MRVLKSNPGIQEEVRRFCGTPDREKEMLAARIARDGTSNDIFCALVFGRFEDTPRGDGPYRSPGNPGASSAQETLARAFVEKARNELLLHRRLAGSPVGLGERIAACLEEQEAWEAKANQLRMLRSHGILPLSSVEELLGRK